MKGENELTLALHSVLFMFQRNLSNSTVSSSNSAYIYDFRNLRAE